MIDDPTTPTAQAGTMPPLPAPVQELEVLMRLRPGQLQPSAHNPRKRFDPVRVQQIADSFDEVGQIQPIRARPNPLHRDGDGRPPFEIVVGETRWRAAQLAKKLPTLDVIVRAYTDIEVLEVQLVENLQRADLHPMEEAEGYGQLLRSPTGLQGHATVADLAARVGKSESYVYQRMKLLALCPAGRDAFFAGHLSASVALLIARMPNQEEQARATARIVAGFGGEPYSYRQAAEYLQKEFMLRLSLARFDITATYAVAGPCGTCKKRSGAEPDLFADVASSAGDMCQDARCYQAKAEEAHQALLQAARDAGRTVLQGTAAKRVLPTPDATPVGYYRLDAPCTALTDSKRTLRDLLGNGTTANIVVVDLPGIAPVELVPEEAARKALKARSLLRQQATPSPAPAPSPAAKDGGGVLFKPAAPVPQATASASRPAAPADGAFSAQPMAGSAGHTSSPAAGGEGALLREKHGDWWNDPKNKVEPRPDGAAGKTTGADVETLARFGQLLVAELQERVAGVAELPLIVLRLLIELLFEDMVFEEAELLYATCGWDIDHAVRGKGLAVDFERRVRAADGRTLGELVALCLVVPDATNGMGPAELRALRRSPAVVLAGHFGIDLDRVLRDAQVATRAARGRGDESVAGAARQGLDMTEVFIQQHGTAAGGAATTPAGKGHEVNDEGASDAPE